MISISVWCLVIIVSSCNSGVTFAAKWSYKNQDEWPKQCAVGKEQSPIDLSPDISEGKNFPPFIFSEYDNIYPANITNNGHSVEIQVDVARKPFVSGGGLNSDYVLAAMHFHWESEHTIEGRRFPLELHLVHYEKKNKDVSQALSQKGGVAVLGVLFYLSPDDDSEFSALFEAIEHLLQKVKLHTAEQINRIELDDFLPRDRAGFYRYSGSLTTPACTEGVIWTVFTNGLPISNRQLKIFSKLVTDENVPLNSNYRPLQELKGRKVQLKVSTMESAGSSNFATVTNSFKIFMLFVTFYVLS